MRFFLAFTFLLVMLSCVGQTMDSMQNVHSPIALDSIPNDSLAAPIPVDSTAKKPEIGDVETTINYNSRDSLYFDVKDRKFFLYGETHIDYGEISLEAERTEVSWEKKTIKAQYTTDSTGKKIGKPVFKEGQDVYVTNDIVYNFDSKRALIKGVVTEQEGGFMHGDDVKKNEKNELFIRGARYTTCNLEHPHFFIESSKLKVIPKNKVVSGPFVMKFRDLVTPLAFPFGMFPQPKKRASGIIVPTYGEEAARGFFLRDGGYYFAVNDYIDMRITGDIYSRGGNGLNLTSNYYKRYAYRGTFNFSYNKLITNDLENPTETNDYWVRWNLTPETRGNSSFSASVSAGTSTYNANNNLVNQDFNRSINTQFTSNVSYSKKFQGTPFNMSLNLRHNQNLATEVVNLTLPDFTLTTSRQYPFKNFVKSSKSPLSKLNFSHNFVAKNDLSNSPISTSFGFDILNEDPLADSTLSFNMDNLEAIYARGDRGGKHTIPVSTSISLLKYFTLNPNFSYTDLWYTEELAYEYDPDEQAVRIDTLKGFSRAGSWSTGASLNTRIYGTKFFNKGKIQAIRHVMTPSLSYTYNPDFTTSRYGVYSDVQIDSTGATETLSRYEGFAYGSPTGTERQSMSFSLSNNIEMKVASKKDTLTGSKKIKLFENLGLGTSYNFAAEEFKLSNISVNARTSFLNGNVSLNFTGAIDPYVYELVSETFNEDGSRTVDQNKLDRYAWNNGQGLGQLSSMTTALNFNLSPKSGKNMGQGNGAGGGLKSGLNRQDGEIPGDEVGFDGLSDQDREEMEFISNNPNLYVDFNVPWTLRVGYSINRTKTGFEDANISQSLNFSGTLGLTDKTQITYNSGYDFESKDFTTTRLGVTRDLHCWTMSFDWVPFGSYQSYFLSIRVKSSLLQDLKIDKRRSFQDFFN